MTTFKITISYDGSDFVGWQRQLTGVSVQGLLEDALCELDGREVGIAGAGRTDAGVHALAQAASVSLARDIEPWALVRALNARLPATVRVLEAEEAPASFHARFDARAKTYRYRIWNGEVLSPFERRYTWHVPSPVLDVAAMSRAAQRLEGRHDFAAFQGAGSERSTTERVVFRSHLSRDPAGPVIEYEVSGGGFLRHMVRNIAGTLVEVGRGRRAPGWIGEVLASRDRRLAGPTAPASGLFLVNVRYGREPALAAER